METSRLEIEKHHHNKICSKKRDLIYGLDIPPFIRQYIDKLLGDIGGKTVIEIGCGRGENLLRLASKGADVFGNDISENMIERCRCLIEQSGFKERINVSIMDAENMSYPDEFADVIFGNGILHHLLLNKAADEIWRCLKKDGVAVFCEALGHNPVINLFRKLTPHRRTISERPLRWDDFDLLSSNFNVSHKEFYFLPILVIPFGILGLRRFFRSSFSFLHRFDNVFSCEFFNRFCWMTVIELRKKEKR